MNRAWAIGAAAAVAAALTAPAPAAAANTVIDWNEYAERATAEAAGRSGQPDRRLIEMAMIQGAVYDAVNAIARTNQPYLVSPRARRWYSKDAAAASAAYGTLVAVVPEQKAMLEPLYDASLDAIPDGAARAGGIRVGKKAARAMLRARAKDGRGAPFPVDIATEPGEWRPTPPAFMMDPTPWLARVKPFLVPSAKWLRTRGPNPLTSAAYAREFVEVKELGSADSAKRTPAQTAVALYWDRPPWSDIVRSIARRKMLKTAESARLLAMVNLATADSQIGCRNDKYYWNWWRPVTAIREAAIDRNPATTPDPNWLSLIETPPYPDHPAGHTCGSAAIVGALQNFFGTTGSPSAGEARARARSGGSGRCPRRPRRRSTHASGAACTSAPRRSRARDWAGRSRAWSGGSTSSPCGAVSGDARMTVVRALWTADYAGGAREVHSGRFGAPGGGVRCPE